MKEDKGLRYNEGKIRYDLMHPVGTRGVARVLTKGAVKYPERNWEQGMQWTKVIASAKRHMAAIEAGEDYDYDPTCEDCRKGTPGGDVNDWHCRVHTGELHADLLQCNAHFLSSYYKIYPQGDNRTHTYLKRPKIGLDIDEVLCDWLGAWVKLHKIEVPQSWWFDRDILNKFERMRKNKTLDKFYLSLRPLISPDEIPFEPHCYITSRPVSKEITEQWLDMHGFPASPVYGVPAGESKLEVIRKSGIDIFVDDRFDNFRELNAAGICTYLMDAPHNRRYDVGHKRIYHLKDLM